MNALLTQLDQIKMSPNVLILTTSNITGAIDGAFVDRADIVQYIGPPNQAAIYQILFSAIQELMSKDVILLEDTLMNHRELELTEFNRSDATSSSLHLWRTAQLCQKAQLSGRALRKVLSFLVASVVELFCPGPRLGVCLVLQPQEEAHSKGVFGELGEGSEEATGREGGSGKV